MTQAGERRQTPVNALMRRYFPPETHPYRILETRIEQALPPDATLLDIGCGRTAPLLRNFVGRAKQLVGVDLVEFERVHPSIELHPGSATNMRGVADRSVDVCCSRSVMEHIEQPDLMFREIARVLKPGGHYVFLTPNRWDYASIAATLIPNHLHQRVVRLVSGRPEVDTFPTFYRANTPSRVRQLAREAELETVSLDYLGQYPTYLKFSPTLFRAGIAYERLIDRHAGLHGLKGWLLGVLRAS